jgi:acetate---CoA ligase (ADP-forming) subunit beta
VSTVLSRTTQAVLTASKSRGWVLEPETKQLMAAAGFTVPRYRWVRDLEAALQAGVEIGYPVVGKVVSPEIIHKSDAGGVVVGIGSERALRKIFKRFSKIEGFAGMLVEETISGIELIVGAKSDYQFGPVILVGIGGTGVEVYQDTSIRMAPITERDVTSMLKGLKAHKLIEGYRGAAPVPIEKLTDLLLSFSTFVMKLEGWFQSIDLNPVICSATDCIIADARIILNPH